jgi:CheY-like chemotaxis protein
MSKSILLLSDHPDDATFLAEVSQSAQATLKIAANVDEAVELLAAESAMAIFLAVDKLKQLQDFEFATQKKFGLFSERVQPSAIHMMADKELSENRDVILSPLFGNYYQRQTENVSQSGEFYGRFVKASEQRSTHDLKHFLSEKGKVQKVVMNHTNQKQEAVEAVRQYLIAAKIPARISNIIANAVDEVIMNAMFDAPCDEFGKPLYSSTARSQERVLTGHEQVAMSIGFDGFYVGVSVADGYGSIDRTRLLNHISANYRDRDYQIRAGQAGAGLGLATIFNNGGSLIYHCEARIKTEATLLYRAYPSYRDFKNQFKFFSAKFYAP